MKLLPLSGEYTGVLFIQTFHVISTFHRESITNDTVSTLVKEHFTVSNPVSFDSDWANRISIRRKHIWKDAVRAIFKPGFNPNRNVRVVFVGEEAVALAESSLHWPYRICRKTAAYYKDQSTVVSLYIMYRH